MKKITLILITSIGINFSVSAQAVGDYRSIASGNWNDPTKWETYDGTSWNAANSYPGQNAGTGAVSITIETEITITASIPNPVSYLYIGVDSFGTLSPGVLSFSSENEISLHVSGYVDVGGVMKVDDQNGAKSHTLFIGGGLDVGTKLFDPYSSCPPYAFVPATFQTINQDDQVSVVFNSKVTGAIDGGPDGVEFQDVTFDGAGIRVTTPVRIEHAATFVNGIITVYASLAPSSGGAHNGECSYVYVYSDNTTIFFDDGAIASGASGSSFVDGRVTKGGNDPFTFPIGNGSVYAPLTISAPPIQGASLTARYVRLSASDLGPLSDSGLFNVSNCEYWDLAGPDNNHPLDITVGWSDASRCGSSPYTDVAEVTLAHSNYDNWNWESNSGSGIGTSTNGSVTWKDATVSGLFTLGNLSSICTAPWGSATNISSNSATLKWTGIGNATSYDVDYKAYNSSEWINAATATSSLSANISGLIPWTSYDWRIRTHCNLSSSSYRQSQFQTVCGPAAGLTTTNITGNGATLSWSAFADNVSYDVEYKNSTSQTWMVAATRLTYPSYILNGLTAGVTYNWRVVVNCTVTMQGGYAQSSFTTLACNDIYEPNNSSSQATPLAFGTTIFANISSGTDVDWFKLNVPGNSTINVFLSNPPADYDLYVYNRNLVSVGSSTTTGNESITFAARGKNLVYYIKVIGKNGAFNASQCYNLVASVSPGTTRQMSHVSDLTDEVSNAPIGPALYPNPASEFIYLQFNSIHEETTEVDILNSLGQIVKRHTINVVPGYNQVKIPISDINPGIYLLRISKGELNMNRKFVIAR